ncbi:MAG: methylmalonyl-CoA mutase family protein [Opitutaceae bacterium]|jgi:methylmalonyl-CoA mutase
MNTPTTAPSLFAEFPAATPADWRKAAEEFLAGAPFEKKLITRTPEGIDLQPIYTQEDTAKLAETWPGLAPYVRGSDALGSRSHGWYLCQEPGDTDPVAFNKSLIHDLQRGQNAVSLPLAMAKNAAVAVGGVDLKAVPLFARAGVDALAVTNSLIALLKKQGKPATDLHGAVLADPLGELATAGAIPGGLAKAYDDMAQLTRQVKADGLALRTLGVNAGTWAEAGANAVQELAFGLATGVEYLRELDKRGLGADEAGPRFLFTYALGSNLFMEIAKLRAARLVWARAVGAAGGESDAQRLVCHGRTTRWNKTVLDPHVNLLRTTTEAFAGIVGGCAGLQVDAFDECIRTPDDLSRRLARNIQIILAEECQLGRVVDPAGGSWYVETLTRQLAEKAWALFQDIESKGGMAAALSEGYPQQLVEKCAADRLAATAGRRDAIIGTNLYPNLKEKLPVIKTVVAPKLDSTSSIKRIVPRRRSEAFEALRRRSEAKLTESGSRPKVFLAGFGPRKQFAARSDFSAGFFAAGGFESVSGKGFETPEAAVKAALESGAPVVVLCSTDETYPTLVPPCAQLLKAAAKAPIVVVAGMPATPELQQQFKAAGVDEFIHVRANCEKVLAGFLTQIGL